MTDDLVEVVGRVEADLAVTCPPGSKYRNAVVSKHDLRTLLAALSASAAREAALVAPITMQDVRLAAGEGPLKPSDVLAGVNAEIERRARLSGQAEGEG